MVSMTSRFDSTESWKENSMQDIFTMSQERHQSQTRLIKQLIKIYKKETLDNFLTEFIGFLKRILMIPEPNDYAHTSVDFVVKFALFVQDSSNLQIESSEEDSNQSETLENDSEAKTLSDEVLVKPFVSQLLGFLSELYEAETTSVRLRSCQIISKLLYGFSVNVTLNDDLFEVLEKFLLSLLKDKMTSVRVLSVQGLMRLQDPSNPECPIVKELLFHLSHDPQHTVRQAILAALGASRTTVLSVLQRTRDVKDLVRCDAYRFLADKIHMKTLSISQRNRLLTEGLKERTDIIKKVVEERLLSSWIKMCSKNLVQFLKFLDIQGSDEGATLALKVIFQKVQPIEDANQFSDLLDENKLIPVEDLTVEKAFYWQSLVSYLRSLLSDDAETGLELIRPDVVSFCKYMNSYVMKVDDDWSLDKKLEHEYISFHLLSIASNYELSDLTAREYLEKSVHEILQCSELGPGVVKPLLTCITKLYPEPQNRMNIVAELISNIREPITVQEVEKTEEERRVIELDIAKIRVELNILREELDEAVAMQSFDKAQEMKQKMEVLEGKRAQNEERFLPFSQQIRVERNDNDTILKCLTMLSEFLLQSKLKSVSPTLRSVIETLILPAIRNFDCAVRNQGVLCLGLCCMIDKNVARQHLILFHQISQIDLSESIQVTALKAIYDLLLFFGLESFTAEEMDQTMLGDVIPKTPPPGGPKKTEVAANIITVLKAQLESRNTEVRTITAIGLGKLLVAGRLYSPQIVTHLILTWFNPVAEDDSMLIHFLGVFLPTLVASGNHGKASMEESFIPALKTIIEAPHTSPLSQVDPVNVGKFLLQLLRPNFDPKIPEKISGETNAHDRIGEMLLNEISKEPDSDEAREWAKLFPFIIFSPSCLPLHKEMEVLTGRLIKQTRDRTALRNLHKYHMLLKDKIATDLANGVSVNSQSSDSVQIDTPDSVEHAVASQGNKTPHARKVGDSLELNSTVNSNRLYSANSDNIFESPSQSDDD